jgi:hypothetical protein
MFTHCKNIYFFANRKNDQFDRQGKTFLSEQYYFQQRIQLCVIDCKTQRSKNIVEMLQSKHWIDTIYKFSWMWLIQFWCIVILIHERRSQKTLSWIQLDGKCCLVAIVGIAHIARRQQSAFGRTLWFWKRVQRTAKGSAVVHSATILVAITYGSAAIT